MNYLQSTHISPALKECNPYYVAVAYIGRDWKNFIDYENLKKIIISPTIGSNPQAIEELASLIGWKSIFFLDNLHAKIYIGKKSVIIGSSNLSYNGLSAHGGLEESAVKITDKEEVKKATLHFYMLKKLATKAYPKQVMKKEKLCELKSIWSKASRNSIIKNELTNNISIHDYEVLTDQDFYIVWHCIDDTKCTYTSKIDHVKALIGEELQFYDVDLIMPNKWVLYWKLTVKNKPDKIEKPVWVYIDEVIEGAVAASNPDDSYTKIAISRNDRDKLEPPFKLTKNLIETFKMTISKEKYKTFIFNYKENDFLVKNTFPLFKEFIGELKKRK